MAATRKFRRLGRRLRRDQGVALIEFAVTLPFMVVLVVGIFDFGSAFNLKQKLTAAAQAGARFAATLPTNDLASAGTPNSVISVRNVIDDYLTAQQVSDCGLLRSAGTPSGNMTWTFQGSTQCPATFTLSIERSYGLAAGGASNTNLITTRISISYPYSFYFGRVSGLLPNGFRLGVGQIGTDAIEPNMD
jgi:Flp pilus assembly protein TadG